MCDSTAALLSTAAFANKIFKTKLKHLSNMQLQDAGVRVLLPYLPWDQNTNPAGQDHVAALVDQVFKMPILEVSLSNRCFKPGLMASTGTQ